MGKKKKEEFKKHEKKFYQLLDDIEAEYEDVDKAYTDVVNDLFGMKDTQQFIKVAEYSKAFIKYIENALGEDAPELFRPYGLLIVAYTFEHNEKKAKMAIDKLSELNKSLGNPFDLEFFLSSVKTAFQFDLSDVDLEDEEFLVGKFDKLEVLKRKKGIASREYIKSLNDVIFEMQDFGLVDDSLELLEDSIRELLEKKLDNEEVLYIYYRIAVNAYSNAGDYENAFSYQRRIMNLSAMLDSDYAKYTSLLIELERYDECMQFIEKTLKTEKLSAGIRSALLSDLADCYQAKGLGEKAIETEKESLRVASVECTDEEMIIKRMNLAELYAKNECYLDALVILQNDFDKDALKKEHDDIQKDICFLMANIYFDLGSLDMSLRFIRMLKPALDKDDFFDSEIYNNARNLESSCYRLQGDLDRAMKTIESVRRKQEKMYIFPEQELSVYDTRTERAMILKAMGRKEEAKKELSSILEEGLKAFGPNNYVSDRAYAVLDTF